MKKINKKVKVKEFSVYDLEGKLENIIAKLEDIRDSNEELFDFEIEQETEYGYYNDQWVTFTVYAWREEFDQEANKRIEKRRLEREKQKAEGKKKKEEQEAKDKAEFLRLAKKFEYKITENLKV